MFTGHRQMTREMVDDRAGTLIPEPGLMAHIVALQQEATRQLERVTAEHGLSLSDYLVLAVIRRSPGEACAPTKVCDVLHRTTGGMTLTVNRLESSGLLTREPDAADGRRILLRLTPKGVDVATATNRALHDWEASITGKRRRESLIVAIRELLDLLGAPMPERTSR